MIRQLIFFICMLLAPAAAGAQRTCVVADMETKIPLKDAIIHTNTNHWARTNYTGQFEMRYAFDSATVSKNGYVATEIYLKELPDTVWLLPEGRQLKEVEVWGENNRHIQIMREGLQEKAREMAAPKSGLSFSLDKLLDVRARRDARHRVKAQKVMRDRDMAGDPIVNAYNQTMEEMKGRKATTAAADSAKTAGEPPAGKPAAAKTTEDFAGRPVVKHDGQESVPLPADAKDNAAVNSIERKKR